MISVTGLVILAASVVLIVVFAVRTVLAFRKLRKPTEAPRGFAVLTPSQPNEEEDVEVEWMKEQKSDLS